MSKTQKLATGLSALTLTIFIASPSWAQYMGPGEANAQPPASQNQGATPPYVKQWFASYDQIRHKAQMTPQERQKADNLLSKGLSIIVPGEEKASTMNLLTSLVNKYQVAMEQMKKLPFYNETGKLHRGYYQYFSDAKNLFSDYLKVQNNLFVPDPNDPTGKPLAGKLLARKQSLEALEQSDKQLDAQTRQEFGIAPYPW